MSGTDAEHGRADLLRNRGALLDSAADVLAADPSASLSEIAGRAGLGRATLYRHFPSRDLLRAAIREEALARAAAALREARLEECSAREGIRRAAAALVPLGMRFRILVAEGADAEPEFVAARAAALQPLAGLVRRGIADGELDPLADPEWVFLVLAALLTTAVRAASEGLLSAGQAPESVAAALFDGFGRP